MAFKAKKGENKHRSHTVDEAVSEVIKDRAVGLSINITKSKRAIFKAKTAANNETMQEVLLRAIDKYLSIE